MLNYIDVPGEYNLFFFCCGITISVYWFCTSNNYGEERIKGFRWYVFFLPHSVRMPPAWLKHFIGAMLIHRCWSMTFRVPPWGVCFLKAHNHHQHRRKLCWAYSQSVRAARIVNISCCSQWNRIIFSPAAVQNVSWRWYSIKKELHRPLL